MDLGDLSYLGIFQCDFFLDFPIVSWVRFYLLTMTLKKAVTTKEMTFKQNVVLRTSGSKTRNHPQNTKTGGQLHPRPTVAFSVAPKAGLKRQKQLWTNSLAGKMKCSINDYRSLNLEKVKIVVYSDSSWANAEEFKSQGGYMVFVAGPNVTELQGVNLVDWRSRRIGSAAVRQRRWQWTPLWMVDYLHENFLVKMY